MTGILCFPPFARFFMLLSGCAWLAGVSSGTSLVASAFSDENQLSEFVHVAEIAQIHRNLRGHINSAIIEANDTSEERMQPNNVVGEGKAPSGAQETVAQILVKGMNKVADFLKDLTRSQK
ncbi:RxLR-like protein [Plasmopara halstedii]|uniref:Secreted RxLR effector protein RXLR-C26 n=1 Tax=Plasmopara halstedii TaxID=4781 RepID=RLR26_PLAHL|nr:RxLR-like protein [Plasmopara halstedii]A0A0P1AL95.1 RecName: Full=Secreted RxLR effector protein RXLR-C26; Flags: Precursor [Plasmopara halstedii]CEG41649.1 RxLR-like protein [Plasmopara halstedii]|eukprot:XP_024578018.1 RxLR-like protein [Plasmopara halstedii]